MTTSPSMRALVLERYNAPFTLTEVKRPIANAGLVKRLGIARPS